MRGRVLIGLTALVILIAGIAALSALRGDDAPTATTSVDLAALGRGRALPVDVVLPDARHTEARVFIVHPAGRPVMALLGVSTHLGCRLRFRGDSAFGEGFGSRQEVAFEDPCGGSTFALDGRCIGGPCPRDLDRYAVELVDDRAAFDLHELQRGPLRGTA